MNPPRTDSDDAADRLLRDPAEKRRLQDTLELVPAGARSILDVGCGSGAFLRLLRAGRPAVRAFGVELTAQAAAGAAAAGGWPCLAADAGRLPFGDAEFDCVSALEILEHLEDDPLARAVRELSRVASRHILVSTPHDEELIRLRCSGCRKNFNPNGHVRRVDEPFLRSLFGGWSLDSRIFVWSERRPYLYRELHGVYARFARPWMAPARCPACGAESGGEPSPPAQTRLGKVLRRALPGRAKHRWIVCLFSRRGMSLR